MSKALFTHHLDTVEEGSGNWKLCKNSSKRAENVSAHLESMCGPGADHSNDLESDHVVIPSQRLMPFNDWAVELKLRFDLQGGVWSISDEEASLEGSLGNKLSSSFIVSATMSSSDREIHFSAGAKTSSSMDLSGS